MKVLLLITLCIGLASCQSCVSDQIQTSVTSLMQCVNGGPSGIVALAQSVQIRVNAMWAAYNQVSGMGMVPWMMQSLGDFQSVSADITKIISQVTDQAVKNCVRQNYNILLQAVPASVYGCVMTIG